MAAVTQLSETVSQIRQDLAPGIPLYMHVVDGEDAVALVDGGLPNSVAHIDRLLAASGVSRGLPLRYLANTHAHHDHIGNFRRLRNDLGSLVVAAPGAVAWIEDVERNLQEFALHHPYLIPDSPALREELAPTYDGDCPVDLQVTASTRLCLGGGVALEAIELPGHMYAELGWFETQSRTLILGDTVTGTDWPIFHGHVDPRAFRATLQKLRQLVVEREVRLVAMSHYEPREVTAFLTLLDRVDDYLDQVWAAVHGSLDEGPASLHDVWLRTCEAMNKEPEFRSLAMVRAHLNELLQDGAIRRVEPDIYIASTKTS